MTARSASRGWRLALVALAGAGLAGCALPRRFTETVVSKSGRRVSFEMVRVPGGRFVMGSSAAEAGRRTDEGPQHEVELSPFYLCTRETTIALFLLCLDETVGRDRRLGAEKIDNLDLARIYSCDSISGPTERLYGHLWGGLSTDEHPVTQVTWEYAVEFCRWLRKKTGRKYRLPSEAEWEYACRAGSTTAYCFGDDAEKLEDYGWCEDNADDWSHPVGEKKPNAWGLDDMHGNVQEWCHDFYDPQAYAKSARQRPTRNPFGPRLPVLPRGRGSLWPRGYHVARGGSWESPAEELRSAARACEVPWWRCEDPAEPKRWWWLPKAHFIGFRVACEPEPRWRVPFLRP